MSIGPNEIRYGRLCLCMLHICPLRLRKIIDNSYHRSAPDFEAFLNNDDNRHYLFHLRSGICDCGHRRDETVINNVQWNMLYEPPRTCQRHSGNCPCRYKAKTGVTSNVLDITLCCLFLSNICPGIQQRDLNHVDTIRQVRNRIIHAKTASIPEQTFNELWQKVKTALIGLSQLVSAAFKEETRKSVDELARCTLDSHVLDSLKNIMKDHREYDSLKKVQKH